MSNVSINLTPSLKEWVESKVQSGRYNNVSEVVREALRLLKIQDPERDPRADVYEDALVELDDLIADAGTLGPVVQDSAEVIREMRR